MKKYFYLVVIVILSALAAPSCVKDGLDGLDGRDGPQGETGTQGSVVTIGEVDGEWWWFINGMKTNYKVTGAAGKDGEDGAPATVVTIIDGYWAFDGVKSEYKAIGENGMDGENIVTLEISPDGYWIINNVKTDVKAKAEDGTNGSSVEVRDDGFLWIDGVKTDIQVHKCKLETFTLTFFLNIDDTEPYLTQVVMKDAWPRIPSKAPSLPQKTFEYWCAAGTDVKFNFDAPITSDVTLYAIWAAGYKYSAPLKLWQTYCASPDGMHEWDDIEAEYTITRLPELPMRTGYCYTDGVNLKFRNLAHGDRHYQYINDYTAYERVSSTMLRFQSSTHEFYFSGGYVYAKLISYPYSERIQIAETSWIYTYAKKNDDVLAITNWGEILVFRNNDWYRMTMVADDIYMITPGAEMQNIVSGKQFYSSIIYQGRTLLGQFPSGKIFEFEGDFVQVSDLSPPEELLIVTPEFVPNGREAQSMAVYGGDLFVGYWPDGVILRYDHKQKQWSQFTRLFDFPAKGGNIRDYIYNTPSAFYGQRVNALVPFEDALYVATSNLNGWHDDIVPSPLLTEEQIRQYGAAYKIYRPGCKTTYFQR